MILDLFAGPGGWSEGIRQHLGLTDVGFEWDEAATLTRVAAGHLTIRADVAQYPAEPFVGRVTGLIASPPCQAWSRAGKRGGLADQPLVHQAVADLASGRDTRAELLAQCKDPRSLLAAEPMRYLYAIRPEWVALEEVPDVLPLFRQYAEILRGWGYSVWCGELNAADYGVPQTRRRAILIASRVRQVAPPEPTHAKVAEGGDLFGGGRHRWVSMADALGWTRGLTVNTRGERKTPGGNEFPADKPSWALTEKARSWVLRNGNQPNAAIRDAKEPAPTMTFGNNAARIEWVLRNGTQANAACRPVDQDAVRITVEEASVLQSFPADYPWQGTKTKRFEQIGNAVPPLLAAHVVAAVTGVPVLARQTEAAAA